MANIKIAIDAGHGSQTAGKRTPDGYREHWANVKVANYFAEAMDRCKIEYIKTGWDDEDATDDPDTSLTIRQKQIKDAKCTHSISWHFNACGDGKTYNSGEGIETLISDKSAGDSLAMANKIQAQLIKGTPQKNRGVKRQALAMCNCGVMGTKASVLVECGFMTNKRESELMQSDAFCKECAEEAAKGFCEYVGVPYIAAAASAPTPITPTPTPVQPTPSTSALKEGDVIQLKAGATYTNGKAIPTWVLKSTLYYRGTKNGSIVFSTQKTGAVTGTVAPNMVVNAPVISSPAPVQNTGTLVEVTAAVLNVRSGPGTSYKIISTVKKGQKCNIIEKNGAWGKLSDNKSWINLNYTENIY